MSISQTNKRIGLLAFAVLAFSAVMLSLSFAGVVKADGNPIFLVRSNSVVSTYPAGNAFSVGTSTPVGTPQTQIGKLSVTLNVTDTWRKAFEVASTTGIGTATTTADLFAVTRAGCINTVATSTATPIHMVLLAVATTSSNGFVTWAYGNCSN